MTIPTVKEISSLRDAAAQKLMNGDPETLAKIKDLQQGVSLAVGGAYLEGTLGKDTMKKLNDSVQLTENKTVEIGHVSPSTTIGKTPISPDRGGRH